MNDLITAATSGLFVEVGKVIEHMKAQASRIADLERQLAEASAPAVVNQPYGWAYECVQPGTDGKGWAEFFNRAKPTSQNGVRNIKPLYLAAPQAAPAIERQGQWKPLNDVQWMNIVNHDHVYESFSKEDAVHEAVKRTEAKLRELNSMAAQAPVREVPETWISVEDRLPKVEELVIVYAPAGKHSEERIDFDFIDPNDDDNASWFHHNEHYEHFCVVAKPEGSIGPSEKAPYTHWMPLPAAPVQQEGASNA